SARAPRRKELAAPADRARRPAGDRSARGSTGFGAWFEDWPPPECSRAPPIPPRAAPDQRRRPAVRPAPAPLPAAPPRPSLPAPPAAEPLRFAMLHPAPKALRPRVRPADAKRLRRSSVGARVPETQSALAARPRRAPERVTHL